MRTTLLFQFVLIITNNVVLSSVKAWSVAVTRRRAVGALIASPSIAIITSSDAAFAKQCTDIESCREIGEQKVEQDLKENPRFQLDNGVSYKVLKPGVGTEVVTDKATVDMIFSINSASGRYMYSRGFGYEKIDLGGENGGVVPDNGLDSYLVKLGTGQLPIGIEAVLLADANMKRGERRRVVLPPQVGFTTSNWKPEPQSGRQKRTIEAYKRILAGNGSNQPPFMAPTIWDIEVLSIRK
jgi:hypothetical protein